MIISLQPSKTKTILQQLEEKGIKVETQCRSGFCSACKCKLKTGVIIHKSDALVLSEDDVLPCSAYAVTTVKLELH